MTNRNSNAGMPSELLRAVAEQLKLPLMQIARQAELGQRLVGIEAGRLDTIQHGAETALIMVDAYLLGLQLNADQAELDLQPVSLGSVLNDAAHQLSDVANDYRVSLELDIAGKYAPVMAHSAGLRAALASLGYGLIAAQIVTGTKRPVIKLAAWRSTKGLVAGLYGDQLDSLNNKALQRARRLYGHVKQPLTELGGGAAGIFVADTLLAAMATHLRTSRHANLSGLGATFQSSRQLQLI